MSNKTLTGRFKNATQGVDIVEFLNSDEVRKLLILNWLDKVSLSLHVFLTLDELTSIFPTIYPDANLYFQDRKCNGF